MTRYGMPRVIIRSSKARVWAEVRTRMAISASLWPSRRRVSMRSPTMRASSSESQRLTTWTCSPWASLRPERRVLPRRPSLLAIRPAAAARMGAVER